jgi:hypothetical protein
MKKLFVMVICVLIVMVPFAVVADSGSNNNLSVQTREYKARLETKDGFLYIKSFEYDKTTNTFKVKITLDYSVIVQQRYKSDETGYYIDMPKHKYYKLGGFEYDGNMCSGKPMHYESEYTISYRDNHLDNHDLWPSIEKDNIAQILYKYLKSSGI